MYLWKKNNIKNPENIDSHALRIANLEVSKRVIHKRLASSRCQIDLDHTTEMQNIHPEHKDSIYEKMKNHHAQIENLRKEIAVEIKEIDVKMNKVNKHMASQISELTKIDGDIVDGTNMIGMWQMVKIYDCNCSEILDGICRGHGIDQFHRKFVPLDTEKYKLDKNNEDV